MRRIRIVTALLTLTMLAGCLAGCSDKKSGETDPDVSSASSEVSSDVSESDAPRTLPEVDPASITPGYYPTIAPGESRYEKMVSMNFNDKEYRSTMIEPEFLVQLKQNGVPFECAGYGDQVFTYTEDGDRRVIVSDYDGNIKNEISISEFWTTNFPEVPQLNNTDHPGDKFGNYVYSVNNGFVIGFGRWFCFTDFRDGSVTPVVIEHDYWNAVSGKDFLVMFTRAEGRAYVEIFKNGQERKVIDVTDNVTVNDDWFVNNNTCYTYDDTAVLDIINTACHTLGNLKVNVDDLSVEYEAVDLSGVICDDYPALHENGHDGYSIDWNGLKYTSDDGSSMYVFTYYDIKGYFAEYGVDAWFSDYLGFHDEAYYFLERESGRIFKVNCITPDKKIVRAIVEDIVLDPIGFYNFPMDTRFINEFNESSDEYYISIYRLNRNIGNFEAEVLAALECDTPPDMVIASNHYTFLDDCGYFDDLSSFVEKETSSDKYYTNVFEGSHAQSDGKLYMLPVAFVIEAITGMNNPETGYTFDDYMECVRKARFDPIWARYSDLIASRDERVSAEYLNVLYSYQSDLFYKDGKYDFNTKAFYDLMDFVKNNNYGRFTLSSMQQYNFKSSMQCIGKVDISNDPLYAGDDTLSEFLNLGAIPTVDGRGPGIIPSIGLMAVTGSDLSDGVYEFMKYALSPAGQYCVGNMMIPVSKDYDSYLDLYRQDFATAEFVPESVLTFDIGLIMYNVTIDTSSAEPAVKIIEGLSVVPSVDPRIEQIIIEESGAYLNDVNDSVTPESVVARINARVEQLLGE